MSANVFAQRDDRAELIAKRGGMARSGRGSKRLTAVNFGKRGKTVEVETSQSGGEASNFTWPRETHYPRRELASGAPNAFLAARTERTDVDCFAIFYQGSGLSQADGWTSSS